MADPADVQFFGLAGHGDEVVGFGESAGRPYLARLAGGAWTPLDTAGIRGPILGFASAEGDAGILERTIAPVHGARFE